MTVTASPVSTYISDVVTIQPTITTIDLVSSVVTTIAETISQFTTVVLTATDVEYSAVTVTTTVVTTPPVTITIKKRNLATDVPSYASACDGPAQYESACSCNGVVGSTSTVTETDFTSTATATTTTTPTVVISTTVTTSLPTTLVETSVVPLTETALTTVLDSISSTVVETAVVPTTTTVTVDVPPPCSTFAIYATSQQSGYLTYYDGELQLDDESYAQPFVYDAANGYIYQAGSANFLATTPASNPEPGGANVVLTADSTMDPLVCMSSAGDTLVDGAPFECHNTQYSTFCICQSYSDFILVLTDEASCTDLFLCAAATVDSIFNQCSGSS